MRSDAQARRIAIVEAATDLFREHGNKVTLESIAAEAGVGIATLYRNFPDKESLKKEVAIQMGQRFMSFQNECIARLQKKNCTEDEADHVVRAYAGHLQALNLEVIIPVFVPNLFHDVPDELWGYRQTIISHGNTFVHLAREHQALGPGVTHLELVVGILSLDSAKNLQVHEVQPDVTRNLIELFLAGLKQGHAVAAPPQYL